MSNFFIRRPIVAIVIAILTVLIGAVSLIGLPISQFPSILPPEVNLNTSYTKVTHAVTAGHSYTLTLVNHDENNPGDATDTRYDDVSVS